MLILAGAGLMLIPPPHRLIDVPLAVGLVALALI